MINPAWLFVLATIIAVFGILNAFKKMMAEIQVKLESGQDITNGAIQKEQTGFFIRVAVAEAIPIVLIVFGFIQMEKLNGPINILAPMFIVLAVFIVAAINVISIRRETLEYEVTSGEVKNIVNSMSLIGIAMISAIPTVSIVALIIMLG
jgi:hypothetical protein